MEREATLLVLALAVCGPLCVAGGMVVRARELDERRAHARIWLPLVPAAVALAALVGWALQAPDDTDDGIAIALLVAALPGAVIAARAMARAALSALRPGVEERPLVATLGLVRPHVVIDPSLAAVLDPGALAAAHAHELAHARHGDPRRIWIAQLASDLQWPAPAARTRFRTWLHALELARDDEARANGADGPDLAAAIVEVARFATVRDRQPAFAELVPPGTLLRERIARLLAPLAPQRHVPLVWLGVVVAAAIAGAIVVGIALGDDLVRLIPGVS